MPANVKTLAANEMLVREMVRKVDLIIGAVLIPGAKAPKLVTRDMLPTMKQGCVLVDVAIDQGDVLRHQNLPPIVNPLILLMI